MICLYGHILYLSNSTWHRKSIGGRFIRMSLSLSRRESAPFKSGRAIFFLFHAPSAHHPASHALGNPLPITLMRPRPPARNTLFTSYTKPSPPPPYGDALTSPEATTLSESATARRIHALAKDVFSGAVPSAIEEWINGQSREELSSLLVRANELIRERERGKSSTPIPFLDMN
jgi:hypothetical protein